MYLYKINEATILNFKAPAYIDDSLLLADTLVNYKIMTNKTLRWCWNILNVLFTIHKCVGIPTKKNVRLGQKHVKDIGYLQKKVLRFRDFFFIR